MPSRYAKNQLPVKRKIHRLAHLDHKVDPSQQQFRWTLNLHNQKENPSVLWYVLHRRLDKRLAMKRTYFKMTIRLTDE